MRVNLPPLHPGQDAVRRSKARFKVLMCGRRYGKTQLAAVLAIACALTGGIVWWVGPTSREASIGWDKIHQLAIQIPGVRIRVADHAIHFPSGGRVQVLSAENKTLRGEGLDLLIVDEAAYVAEAVWLEDLRASLSDREGQAVFISTPDGRNWLYRLYLRGQSPDWPEWESWQHTTYENPFISDSEIDAARAELPDWVFAQEYLAEPATFAGKVYKTFSPTGASVFHEANLARYTAFYGGLDFGFRNPTSIGVAGLDKDGTLDFVDSVYETGLTPPDVIEQVRGLTERYGVRRWWADPSDPSAIKELQQARLPVYPAPRVTGHLERSWVKNGIILVEKRLIADPPALRFMAPTCRDVIREMDLYRYPQGREGAEEKEAPLKVDDHGPDMVRYVVAGVEHEARTRPRVRVLA